MRLKEPLYGIKIAQMHFLSHLSLLMIMLILEYEILNEGADWNNITDHSERPEV